MRHVVYGTAGHIDHGKTSLVKALTGIDCDRLPEERDRGITIDLGFAHLEDQELVLHFVDVPGHERLVHTMIAGASGIDLALLVVAADEGVMPQTREHLEVIRLMGVAGGAVALTKVDLVDRETAEFAIEEVREILEGTPFAEVPILPVSASTGEGLSELRKTLLHQALSARPHQVEGRPFREAIDRVFSLSGAGTVVTGTSLWGRLEVGRTVTVLPSGLEARVRRLHVHGEERKDVEAGERVALNIVGLAKGDCDRGSQIMTPGPWVPTRLLSLRLEVLASAPSSLDEGDEVELHALAARSIARIDRLSDRPVMPGHTVTAQISLSRPMMLFPGDRVVLRRSAPVNTFAGGLVLDTRLRRFRRKEAADLHDLPTVQRGAWPQLFDRWIGEAGLVAPSLDDLSGRLGVLPEIAEATLGRLLAAKNIRSLETQPPRFVKEDTLVDLVERARCEIGRRLQDETVSSGVPARDFMSSLLSPPARFLAPQYLDELRYRKVLELVEGRVLPPGVNSHMSDAGAKLSRRLDDLYREASLEPPSPGEAAERIHARPAMVEGVCKFLVQQGVLVRLEGRWYIHRSALDEIVRVLRGWSLKDFGVADFKAEFGLTRKLAIPILEWLDSERITVRTGNRRRVIGRQR
ncbi:MAG: selenocysteine-specific translation elongation factor [Thermoanaerobaculales bacterium]|nr:selenocysteine-specific translation elongation factor [Thermoanaerobaculales bacterium]